MLQSRHAARLALPGPEAACCSDMRKWTKKAFTWAILPMLMPTSTGFSFTPACWLGHVHRRVSCAPARASFLRHVVSCGPDDISSTDHLYSYGADKLRREITINGVPAVDLICWPFVMGQPCDCGGAKAHLDHLRGACGKHLSGELGACSGCKKNRPITWFDFDPVTMNTKRYASCNFCRAKYRIKAAEKRAAAEAAGGE